MNAKNTYREKAAQGASRVGLVVLLYEQIIDDLRRAVEALEQNQIELRTRHINHAILVIGYLQSTLDQEQGGKVAQNLELFYNVLRGELVEAQARASKAILKAQMENMLTLRDAWIAVDRAQAGPRAVPEDSAASGSDPVQKARGRWKA